eukprot:m.27900 g.27900  ORF g.27900 m.27900 type:complete len:321 (-) comp7949_c0_seq2:703-1665(-)
MRRYCYSVFLLILFGSFGVCHRYDVKADEVLDASMPGKKRYTERPQNEYASPELDEEVEQRHEFRERRALFKGPTISFTYTKLGPFPTLATSTGSPTSSSTTDSVSLKQVYAVYNSSAIQMMGRSYFVNYNQTKESLDSLMRSCYEDASCVSFDYDLDGNEGWSHRIPAACAEAAGGKFLTGRSKSTVFYQLKQPYLEQKGNFAFLRNYTDENGRYLPIVEKQDLYDEITELCNIKQAASLSTPQGRGMTWLRAIGTSIATLAVSGGTIYVIMIVIRATVDRYELRQILNREVRPEDVHLGEDDDSGDEAEPLAPDENIN